MKTALIIDDVEVSRYALGLLLEELEFNCTEAENEQTAKEALLSQPSVVFLDWHLKRENGLGLIEKIKAISGGVPIVVVSGVEGMEKAEEAKNAGASVFLQKPIQRVDLESSLRQIGII